MDSAKLLRAQAMHLDEDEVRADFLREKPRQPSSWDTEFARPVAGFKIIHAAETSGGGIATYISTLLRLQRDFFGAGAISVVLPESQSHFLAIPEGVEVVIFSDRSNRITNSLRLAQTLKRLIRSNTPDVVHLHSTFAGAVLRPLLLNLRGQCKVIYCPHGWAFDRRMSSYGQAGTKWVERRLSHLCDAIVCVSYHEVRAARACGISQDRLALIRNGAPAVSPTPSVPPESIEWPPGRRRILFIGRFDVQKGVDVLIGALGRLGNTVFASIVGGAVVGDSAVVLASENARMYGWLDSAHLEAFYRSAEVVVIPSRWEGFGLVAVEAMRAGLPVIASAVGGLTEIVDDGVTGVLIPADDADALAHAISDLSDVQLKAMGKAGRERFLREFSMERTHRQLCSLYFASQDSSFAAMAR